MIAAIAIAGMSSIAWSTLYKWTDADGRVVYSDQPPVNRKVDKVMKRATTPPAERAADAEGVTREPGGREAAERADAARREGKDEARDAAADPGRRAEECTRVRASLDLLKGDSRLYRVDAKGQEVPMDEAARRRATDENNAFLKAYCSGG